MHAAVVLALLFTPMAWQEPKGEFKVDEFIANAVKPDPKDTPLRKLQKERCIARAAAVDKMKEIMDVGTFGPEFYRDYIKLRITLGENLGELADKPADKVKCYELRLDAAREFEVYIFKRIGAGNEPIGSLNIAKASRIDAEIDLLKLKAEIEKAGKK
jgi:hypothetical protein